MNISLFCADIGSVARGNFGWYGVLSSRETRHGDDPETLVLAVSMALDTDRKVALGFECPLFVPLPQDPNNLTTARAGEGSRAWSAGAGAGVLAIGLTEVAWILRELRRKQPVRQAYLEWDEFITADEGLFLWEAFVSGKAKQGSHQSDAKAAVDAFQGAIAGGAPQTSVTCEDPYSLIGAALLRTGWVSDPDYLRRACLVVRA